MRDAAAAKYEGELEELKKELAALKDGRGKEGAKEGPEDRSAGSLKDNAEEAMIEDLRRELQE